MPLLHVAVLVPVAVLGGCASGGGWPSLARRPVETAAERPSGSAAPAAAQPGTGVSQQTVPAELSARLAALEQAARESHQRFQAKRTGATSAVNAARGGAVASEAWSVATVALADLESARSDAMVSLGELDRLYAADQVDGGNGEAIAAVRDQVTAWIADEDAVLADLGSRLKS